MSEAYVARLEKALEFYADPTCYFAIAMIGDSPVGPFYWDLDETHGDDGMPGPRRGAFARAALRNEDYEPPYDFADFKERHPELCADD